MPDATIRRADSTLRFDGVTVRHGREAALLAGEARQSNYIASVPRPDGAGPTYRRLEILAVELAEDRV